MMDSSVKSIYPYMKRRRQRSGIESIKYHLTQDTIWERDKNTIKHNSTHWAKRSVLSLQVTTRLPGKHRTV